MNDQFFLFHLNLYFNGLCVDLLIVSIFVSYGYVDVLVVSKVFWILVF